MSTQSKAVTRPAPGLAHIRPPQYRVMVARIPGAGCTPLEADLVPFLVVATSTTHAIRQACEDSVRQALSLTGSSVVPVDVHVVYMHGDGASSPAQWEAEVRWRSSGKVLAHTAGNLQRVPS